MTPYLGLKYMYIYEVCAQIVSLLWTHKEHKNMIDLPLAPTVGLL